MADEALSALTLYTSYHAADEVLILDTVDTTMASTGTDKRIQFSTLLSMAGVGTVAGGGTGLTAAGSADQLLGVQHTGGGLEYKTLAAGSNITLTPAAGSITIAASGTVTSVGLSLPPFITVTGSPVTSSGTLTGTLATQAANTQLAGPTTGSAAAPTFRALVAGDMPASVVLTSGSYSSPAWLTQVSGGIVSGNIGGNAASITGSITTSQVSNLGSWAGSTAITTLGTIATGTIPAANVGGQLTVAQGGTGAGTLTAHAVVLGEGTSTPGFATVGTAGRHLVDQGAGADPAFVAISGDATGASTGALTIAAGAVTLAKQANFAASSLMGNPTGSSAAPSAITLGANLSFSGTTLVATAGGGMTNPMTTAGDTIIGGSGGTPGRLGIGSSTQVYTVVSGAPAWAAISATNITTGTLPVAQVPSLPASQITSGQIGVAQGGTGLGTLTAHAVMLGEGTSSPGFATIGTAGRLLIDQGAADPAFEALSGDATITSAGALTVGAGAITLAKQANFAASSLMGNPTGSSAAPSAITLGANLSFSGTTLVAAGGGMSNPMTTAGDVIIGGSSGTPARLGIGTTNYVLTVVAGAPAWAAASGGVTVGGAVGSPVNNAVLYINSSGNLAASANLTYSGTVLALASSTITCPGSGTNSEAFGSGAVAAGNSSTAIGHAANAGSGSTIAIGLSAAAGSNGYTIIIGASAATAGGNNVMIGYQVATSGGSASYNVIIGSNASGSTFANSITIGNAATCTAANQMTVGSTTSYINTVNVIGGTGGSTLNLEGFSSTTERPCGIISSSFNTSTDASWSGNLLLYAGDYTSSNAGKRLGFQVQSNGSAALIGHYGATPVVQPVGGGGNTSMTANTGTAVLAGSTFTGASGSSTYTIGDIVTALKALGLLTA